MPVVAHPGEVRAVRAEQPLGLLDDSVEDDLRLAQGRDPGGDVAQRPLRVGAAGDGRLRALELLDEPGVGDRDRRLVGETAEDGGVDVVEGMRLAAIDLDGAERALVADDRRDDEVADAGPPGEVVGAIDVLELAGEVVARRDDPALGHRPAGQALADPHRRGTHRLALLIGQPRVVGRDEDPVELVVLVDDGAVGAQQPARLVDDALEQVARLADGGDPRGDLAQRPLGLGPPLDDRARPGQLLDAVARCGSRSTPASRGRSAPPRRRRRRPPTWRDTTDRVPIGPASPGSGTATTERMPVGGDELARRVVAGEAVVGEVVVGVDRALLGERRAGHRLAGLEAAGLRPVRDDGHRRRRPRTTSAAPRWPGPTGRSGRRRTGAGGSISSTICWSTSSGSRMADTRAAISRRVCSESARRAISVRERSSSSMSRAFAIATAAWSASADRRPASASPKASGRSP